jgi:hypothetical protein
MKKLMMILMLSAFCLSASANEVLQQDTTKTRQDTTRKHGSKNSPAHKKPMKKNGSKQDTLKRNGQRRDTTVTPPQK